MPKRRSAARKALPAAPPVRRGVGALLLYIAALGLAVGGALQLRALWRSLPRPMIEGLDRQDVNRAFTTARAAMSAEARAGLILGIVSEHFTDAWQSPDLLPAELEEARGLLAQVTATQVGRLQFAAFAMLRLHQEGVAYAGWWPSLEPYLSGLESASLAHFLPGWIATNTAAYTQMGLGPGTARLSAESSIGFPHGPFLEYFVEQMALIARARQDAGDFGAAAQCERLVRRLLRQWVLDPGPAALRLLAADLLARRLQADDGADAPPAAAEIVGGLQRWREAYRDHAGRLSAPLPLLNNSYGPLLNPAEHDRLRDAVALNTWLAGALGIAAAATLLLGWFWLRGRRLEPGLRSAVLTGLGISIVIVALGLMWLDLAPGSVQGDLRHTGGDALGWPRHPFVAGAVLLVLLGAATFAFVAAGTRWQRAGAYATCACVGLALALLTVGVVARAESSAYERSLARAFERGEFETIAGAEADRELAPLRAWNP